MATRVHFCWQAGVGGPCCTSDEVFHEKLSVALVNFYLSSTFEQVSLSRGANVAKARKRLIIGVSCQRMDMSASHISLARLVSSAASQIQACWQKNFDRGRAICKIPTGLGSVP